MKTSNLVLLGLAGVAGYLILKNRTNNISDTDPLAPDYGPPVFPIPITPYPTVPSVGVTNYGLGAAASNVLQAMNEGRISSNTQLSSDWTPSTGTNLSNIGAVLNLNPANPNLFSDEVLKRIQASVNKK
jgi:hypothetical protein